MVSLSVSSEYSIRRSDGRERQRFPRYIRGEQDTLRRGRIMRPR